MEKTRPLRRYTDFELAKPLGRESVVQAGNSTRVFEEGAAWFRLCQKLEAARKQQEGVLYGNPESLKDGQVAYAMGVVQTINAVYTMFNQIVQEAAEERG